MSIFSLQEAIDLAGGSVTPENCPSVFPVDHFLQISIQLQGIGRQLDGILKKSGSETWGGMALTLSSSFSCKVRPIQDKGYAILIPIGVPARLRVLSRLLLSYWHLDSSPRFIRSPLDDVPGDRDAIPPLLKPLFLETVDTDYWDQLQELDRTIELDDGFEPDIQELVAIALIFLISHEFTHILHGHFDLMKRAENETLSLSQAEIRRGIEIDGDDGAAAISLWIQNELINEARAAVQQANQELGWLRLAYAVTMIFAISDAHQKYFGAYDRDSYNHPMVRCELFLQSAQRAISGPEGVQQSWVLNSSEGWKKCIMALENLTMDALSGKFGKLPEGVTPAPLHTLNYSGVPLGPTDWETMRKCREATNLLLKIRRLLPVFANSFSDDDGQLNGTSENSIERDNAQRQGVVGVFGVDADVMELLRNRLGSHMVRVYTEMEPPAEIQAKGSAAANIYAKNVFLDSVDHIVLQIQHSPVAMSWLFGSLLRIRLGHIKSLTCLADIATEKNLRALMQNLSETANEPTAETLEADGKLLFLEQFDMAAFEKQLKLVTQL